MCSGAVKGERSTCVLLGEAGPPLVVLYEPPAIAASGALPHGFEAHPAPTHAPTPPDRTHTPGPPPRSTTWAPRAPSWPSCRPPWSCTARAAATTTPPCCPWRTATSPTSPSWPRWHAAPSSRTPTTASPSKCRGWIGRVRVGWWAGERGGGAYCSRRAIHLLQLPWGWVSDMWVTDHIPLRPIQRSFTAS